jgi:hypothetical protein
VDIGFHVGAPLGRRAGRRRKTGMKGCLKGGSGKKKSANDTKKERKLVREKFKCRNCHELRHRKNSPKCPLNGTRKMQVLGISHFSIDYDISHSFLYV